MIQVVRKHGRAAAGYDRRHREECEIFDIFPSVWIDQLQELPEDVCAVILRVTDEDITSATRPLLERWFRAVGGNPRGLLVDERVSQKDHRVDS